MVAALPAAPTNLDNLAPLEIAKLPSPPELPSP